MTLGLPRWHSGKNLPANARDIFLGQEDPLEKEMATHYIVFSPGKSYGQRSLVGYNP